MSQIRWYIIRSNQFVRHIDEEMIGRSGSKVFKKGNNQEKVGVFEPD